MQRFIVPSPNSLKSLSKDWKNPLFIFESEDLALSSDGYWNLTDFARVSLYRLLFDEYSEHIYFIDTPVGANIAELIPSGTSKKVILRYNYSDNLLKNNLYDAKKDNKRNGLLIAPSNYPNKLGGKNSRESSKSQLDRCDSIWKLAFKSYPYIVVVTVVSVLGNIYNRNRNFLQITKNLGIGHYTVTSNYPETNYNPNYSLQRYLSYSESVGKEEIMSTEYMLRHREMILLYNWSGIGKPIFPLLSLLCFSHLNHTLATDFVSESRNMSPISIWGELFNEIVETSYGLLDYKSVIQVCERYPTVNSEYVVRACRQISYLSKKNKLPVGKFDIIKFENLLYELMTSLGYKVVDATSSFLPTMKTKSGYLLPGTESYIVMKE